MGVTAVSIYKLALLLISRRIPGMPRNARPARRRYQYRQKSQLVSLSRPHRPVENGCKTWNMMRFSELANLLRASRESYGQQIHLHFGFSQSTKEITGMAEQQLPSPSREGNEMVRMIRLPQHFRRSIFPTGPK